MTRSPRSASPARLLAAAVAVVATAGLAMALPAPDGDPSPEGVTTAAVNPEQVEHGRQLVLEHACGLCHGGTNDPTSENWLIGVNSPDQEFRICPQGPDGDCFMTRPRNLTPDNLTGLGRFSERQIFNALRFGLRPGETEDVEITSMTPGVGNFPENPKFLAPPMPWPAWRLMSDDELWAVAAYLKNGVKPVRNRVEDSEGPPDFWAAAYGEMLPPYPPTAFPTANEKEPAAGVDRDQVMRGRHVALQHDCGGCHVGGVDPTAEGWLAGFTGPSDAIPIGDCDSEEGCLVLRPRNLTPHETTGIGRFTDRQIFNALRFGLKPSEAPDMEITSTTPGEGNHPMEPHYLGPGMPWISWRHMPDEDLWALIAYLRHGLKPVENDIADSDSPPDHWAGAYTPEAIGSWPAPPFPTDREVAPGTSP